MVGEAVHILRRRESIRKNLYSFVDHWTGYRFFSLVKRMFRDEREVCSAGTRPYGLLIWLALSTDEFFNSLDP